jgi:hypothetical protein
MLVTDEHTVTVAVNPAAIHCFGVIDIFYVATQAAVTRLAALDALIAEINRASARFHGGFIAS